MKRRKSCQLLQIARMPIMHCRPYSGETDMPLLKGSAGKAAPQKAIAYITRKDKAEYIDVQNLFIDEDYAEQFRQTGERFGKYKDYGERKYYHFKLSPDRGEHADPFMVQEYAKACAEKMFEGRECVIATYTDTQTVHAHNVVNAVHPLTGYKTKRSGERNRRRVRIFLFGFSEESGKQPNAGRAAYHSQRRNELEGGIAGGHRGRETVYIERGGIYSTPCRLRGKDNEVRQGLLLSSPEEKQSYPRAEARKKLYKNGGIEITWRI